MIYIVRKPHTMKLTIFDYRYKHDIPGGWEKCVAPPGLKREGRAFFPEAYGRVAQKSD
jgi:hypothetical protein